jgi:hypothetical protein
MQLDAFLPGRRAFTVSVAAAVAALAVPNAFSADRMVLGEFFTWVNCPSCEIAEPLVANMIDEYGCDGSSQTLADRLAVLSMHVWDGYETPWSDARRVFYAVNSPPIFEGTPCFAQDGLQDNWPIDMYETNFLNRVGVPTPVTLTIYADPVTATRFNVTVEACLEAGADPVDLRIYTVVAEDNVLVNDPDGNYHARNFFRAAQVPTDITLNPGECVEVTNLIVMSVSWQLQNLMLLAWAQEPNQFGPAEVYQAALDPFPWEPTAPPCPWDCQAASDGAVGVNDFLQLLADWNVEGACDFDGGGTGVTDFLELLAHWGTCPE